MFDAFEVRLVDLLADRLAGDGDVQRVIRPHDRAPTAGAKQVLITARVLDGEPREAVGDDRREVLGEPGAYGLRPVLRLGGEVLVELEIGRARGDDAPRDRQRSRLLGVLDRTLLALHAADVRNGHAFETDEDQGFALVGFRLARIVSEADNRADLRRYAAYFRYEGRFWAVEPAVEGDIIRRIPTRMVTLPAEMAESLSVRAGTSDFTVPVHLHLEQLEPRAVGEADPLDESVRLMARLAGASPPGGLVGTTEGVPDGYTAFDIDGSGTASVVYRPPATVSGSTLVRIQMYLARARAARIALGELEVEVREP